MTATLTSLLLERLAPWLTPETDPTGDHANLLSAKAAMAEPLFSLVVDQGFPDDPDYQPGWSQLFDVDLCPFQYLPFLAQCVGVPASALIGQDDATARQIIRAEQGFQRGTPGAIIAAAKRNLTTDFLVLQERTAADGTPDAWHAVVGFRPADLRTTEQDLINAVEATKPAGIQITYVSSAGFTWNEAIHTFSADAFSFAAAFATQP